MEHQRSVWLTTRRNLQTLVSNLPEGGPERHDSGPRHAQNEDLHRQWVRIVGYSVDESRTHGRDRVF
jgi:hypothetical protein